MRLLLAIFFVLLVCASIVPAISFDHDLDNDVIISEYRNNLSFTLDIEDATPGTYNVYTLSDVHIVPFEPFVIDSSGSTTKTFTIIPMERLFSVNGTYIITYVLHHRGFEERYEQNLAIKVLSVADMVVVDTNLVNLSDDSVTISFRNLYDVAIPNVTVHVSSLLFDATTTLDLSPRDTVTFRVPVSNDELRRTNAGSYLMEVVFETPHGPVTTYGTLYLMARGNVVTQEDSGGLFVYTTTISKINTGNTLEDVRVEVQKNIITQFFTTFSEEPLTAVRDGSEIVYVWEKKLVPSEVYTVTTKTNFVVPLIVILIMYIIYFYLKHQLTARVAVKKLVTPVRARNGEFALRVRVIVHAKEAVQRVQVIDTIPRTVKIYKKFGLSMPDEIDVAHRRLKWQVGDLRSGEERVFSYVVYSRVGFLGRFVLPAARVLYHFNDRDRKAESGSTFFVSDESSSQE